MIIENSRKTTSSPEGVNLPVDNANTPPLRVKKSLCNDIAIIITSHDYKRYRLIANSKKYSLNVYTPIGSRRLKMGHKREVTGNGLVSGCK